MLIIFRRLAAILLSMLFLLLFLVTLVVLRVNGTVLEPKFYTETLERLDFYNFLYDSALPEAIRQSDVDLNETVPLGLDLTPEKVSAYVERVLPPSWVQRSVEEVVGEALPYVVGETESFTVTIEVGERVEEAVEVVKELAAEAEVYDYLLDEVVAPEVEKSKEDFLQSLPFGVSLTTDEILQGVRDTVPEDWLKEQILSTLDEVTPYIVGQSDSFRVVIPLEERATAGLAVLERWLQKSLDGGAYDYLLQEQIAPLVTEGLAGGLQLPFGLTISDQEIVDAIAEVLTRDWVSEQVAAAFDELGPYLVGKSDALLIEVPIQDRLLLASRILVERAEARLKGLVEALPTCTQEQLRNFEIPPDRLPDCLPEGMTYEQAKQELGVELLKPLADGLVSQLPPTLALTERDLFAALGDDSSLDTVRGLLRDGYVFTEQDLRTLIADQGSTDLLGTFDNFRAYNRDGFTFTSDQLRNEMGSDQAQFDEARSQISRVRSLLWLSVVLLVVVLAAIGFLGGRSWWSRLGWAGVPLAVAGLIVAIAIGLGVEPVRSFTDEAIRAADVPQAFRDKLIEVREELLRAFVNPVRLQAIFASVVGVAMVGAGIAGPRMVRSGVRRSELPPLAEGRVAP